MRTHIFNQSTRLTHACTLTLTPRLITPLLWRNVSKKTSDFRTPSCLFRFSLFPHAHSRSYTLLSTNTLLSKRSLTHTHTFLKSPHTFFILSLILPQSNSYDCGVYLLHYAEEFCGHVRSVCKGEGESTDVFGPLWFTEQLRISVDFFRRFLMFCLLSFPVSLPCSPLMHHF